MNADRALEEQSMASQTPVAMAAAKKMNAWAAARHRGARAVPAPTPISSPMPDPGQVQPDFAAAPGAAPDPFDAPVPQAPLSLSRAPVPTRAGNRGMVVGLNEDMRMNKATNDLTREKQLNVYQNPEDYLQHQDEVMQSPLLQKLQEGADRAAQLREAYIKNAPVMTDLSPVMAMADYMAKGKGTAQAGYKRPDNYDDMVSHISGLLAAQDKNQLAAAQLGSEQTGPLKSGAETAGTKTGVEQSQQAGTKEEPIHLPLMNPFVQAKDITQNYLSNPTVKEVNDEVSAANQMQKLLSQPNWYTNRALAGSAVKAMGFNRITQGEFSTLGGGSGDLWNRASNIIRTGVTGESLSPTDIRTITDFNAVRLKAALAKRDQIHQSYQQGLGSVSMFGPQQFNGLMGQGDVQPDNRGMQTSDEKARAMANELMQQMRSMK